MRDSNHDAVATATHPTKSEMKLFPLFLKLEGRRCLVVGAGKVAESKIAGLLDTGARVHVVAPEATARVRAWSRAGRIVWEERRFHAADLEGVFLVVAATSSPLVHEEVFAKAQRKGVLCNIVDVPRLCDFYYPAVVRRGSLQIAISTSGESPALAQRLRKDLERQFGAEYGLWLRSLGKEREKIQANHKVSANERKRLLHGLASRKAFEGFQKSAEKKAKKKSRRA
jgi:precorrin-2 dehydrogenase / sirohydrochlorin ferrochelatase